MAENTHRPSQAAADAEADADRKAEHTSGFTSALNMRHMKHYQAAKQKAAEEKAAEKQQRADTRRKAKEDRAKSLKAERRKEEVGLGQEKKTKPRHLKLTHLVPRKNHCPARLKSKNKSS